MIDSKIILKSSILTVTVVDARIIYIEIRGIIIMKQFEILSDKYLESIRFLVEFSPRVYCVDVNGRAKCSINPGEFWDTQEV